MSEPGRSGFHCTGRIGRCCGVVVRGFLVLGIVHGRGDDGVGEGSEGERVIKYLGSKRTLIPMIVRTVGSLPGDVSSVVDLFSGTSRVGHALKGAGYRVVSNDHNAYASTLARCYVQADRADHARDAALLIRELNGLPGRAGYFTWTFCERSRYVQPRNGERIDSIREEIARKSLEPELESIMLVSLMEAADRVDSTAGVQMAYLKGWADRSSKDLELRLPELLDRPACGKCEAHGLDAVVAAGCLKADVVYVDPPYNQHSYLGNYHVWESLVLWDKPDVYGVACKRVDCRDRRSDFNSKRLFAEAMRGLLAAIESRYVLISFSNEGFIDRVSMELMLRSSFGDGARVVVLENDYKRYVGAQIGIYNPSGEKVGRVSHLRNTEYLFVVDREGELCDVGEAMGGVCARGAAM